jgi:hypothetical protein
MLLDPLYDIYNGIQGIASLLGRHRLGPIMGIEPQCIECQQPSVEARQAR